MKLKFLSLNLDMMVRNFYFFTIFAVIIGGFTYFAVRSVGKEVSIIKDKHLPLLLSFQEMQSTMGEVSLDTDDFLNAATTEGRAASLEKIKQEKAAFKESLSKAMESASGKEDALLREIESKSKAFFNLLEGSEINRDDIGDKLSEVIVSLDNFSILSSQSIGDKFRAADAATTRAVFVVISLTLMAIVGMVVSGLVLQKVVGSPVSSETERLMSNSKDMEKIFGEINDGTKKQTEVVKVATSELEDMIINIIQGSISLSVDKQAEISRSFVDFLRHFVERTSVEIAMGMMSVSQQSKDARKGIEDFVQEVATVETNIKAQEAIIGGMVDALKSIVEANKEIKGKAKSSMDAADKANAQAYSGQEKVGMISEQLQEIKASSEGVKEITDSLAKITESIKILALNMSLKVEDIKDDTGKTYGFEAMSAKVQKLAEEVESLLDRSRDMIIPTIQGIAKVSLDANQTRELIAEVVRSVKVADDQSKSIAAQIDKQAADIDRVEVEAENLRALAHKTTLAVVAQATLAKDVDSMLKDSEALVDSVNSQTQEASEGARKVNQMMEQLKQTVASIEDGTGRLTEKSAQISDMFDSIKEMAVQNRGGAERLEGVTASVREISSRLSEIVKGEATI